ncbi:hypothetical protein PMAYCL1PPCAC_26143, partial [Pristionchus mayeri]
GLLGTLLNCTVIYLLWRRKYRTNLLSYRICITISSMQCALGLLGTVLNCTVIYLLWRRKYHTNLLSYRICITISSIQWLLMSSIVVGLSNTVLTFATINEVTVTHIFCKSMFQSLGKFLLLLVIIFGFLIWQLVPGSCLLQYLILCK